MSLGEFFFSFIFSVFFLKRIGRGVFSFLIFSILLLVFTIIYISSSSSSSSLFDIIRFFFVWLAGLDKVGENQSIAR